MRLMSTYFPGEEYLPWMMNQIKQDVEMQEEVDIVNEFWNKVATSQVGRQATLDTQHVATDGHKLYVWWPGVMDAIFKDIVHLGHAKSTIRTAVTEEPYYIGKPLIAWGRRTMSVKSCPSTWPRLRKSLNKSLLSVKLTFN